MPLRLRRADDHELACLLAGCAGESLTYGPTGGSLGGPLPDRFRRRRWTTALGGPATYAPAVAALFAWAVHRGAGLDVLAGGPLAVSTDVAIVAPLPVGFVEATCRIVAVVDEASRAGFAYGTLPVHPERGEESFVVARGDDGSVTFSVEAVSRPAHPLARLAPPVAEWLQHRAVNRYLEAMRSIVSG